MQPIAGAQLTVDFADAESLRTPGEPLAADAGLGNLVLLAMDEEGYLNLMQLVSAAWTAVEPGRRRACCARRGCGRRAEA